MIKKIILLLLLISPADLLAQAQSEDVIYLKNGSVLRGEIIEIKANESVTIEIIGGNIIVINMEDVEEIKKEEKTLPQYYKSKGYVNFTGAEVLPGDENSTFFRYQMVNGYQFSPFFSAGVGLGYVTYGEPLDALPLFMDFRLHLKESNASPFLFLKTGYNFSLMTDEDWIIEDHSGGLMLNTGLGLQYYSNENIGWYFTVGFGIDKLSYEERDWNGRALETALTYKRISFGFGLTF